MGCPCAGSLLVRAFEYHAPPAGETRYTFADGQPYWREVCRCGACGHFVSRHHLDEGALYGGQYVDSTYGDYEGICRAHARVMGLPPERSDNAGRVQRLIEFAAHYWGPRRTPRILDVGSGLCVFLTRMKAAGWEGTALDPDPRAARHAEENVGVRAICGDFMAVDLPGGFDAVSFNKVLEHVPEPQLMLLRAKECLAPGGFVYVEVPDGEAAAAEGPGREEFFIEHLHVFSAASLAALGERAGFRLRLLERLREPSSKFTLRAFLSI
ncbi:MAG: class I SAM-dependent methyltransferase [Candidatus Handelsmanbacteria bacterium]|nr:class I SAM-dependent methyltransferase [Candidatus Handelsmanbacteria bacterium]